MNNTFKCNPSQATNKYGEATTSCNLLVTGREGICEDPQVSADATRTIMRLEEALHRKDEVVAEEERPIPPVFVKEMQVSFVKSTDKPGKQNSRQLCRRWDQFFFFFF